MSDSFIDPDWLEVVKGKKLLYPSAYFDHEELIAVFQDYIDEFWFCDTNYPPDLEMEPALNGNTQFQLVDKTKSGAVGAKMEHNTDSTGNRYRYLEPSRLTETYERDDGRLITVVRRRGFGQIAITKEFTARELGVFTHRGDSTGDGGSNIYYLANLNSHYEPVGNLFQKTSSRFGDKALVISDGSLTTIRHLKKFHLQKVSGSEVFEQLRGIEFTFGAFQWACAGWMRYRNGPTLVWGLTRQHN